MLPIAARLEAWWARMTEHVDPEAAFKQTVSDGLKHLEQRIEEVAKGALPVDVSQRLQDVENLLRSMASTTDLANLKADLERRIGIKQESAPPAPPAADPEAAAPGAPSAAAPAASNHDDDPQAQEKGPGEKQAGGEGNSAGSSGKTDAS